MFGVVGDVVVVSESFGAADSLVPPALAPTPDVFPPDSVCGSDADQHSQ